MSRGTCPACKQEITHIKDVGWMDTRIVEHVSESDGIETVEVCQVHQPRKLVIEIERGA